MSNQPKVKSSNIVYNGFFDVKEDILERSDGKTGSYTSLLMSVDAAIVLAQDVEGRWILNREYRHPTKKIILGCSGGRLEKGENPLLAAQRELFEETGYWSDEIRSIGSCYQSPAISDQIIHYFFAPNAMKTGKQKLDPLEYIETCLMTQEELLRAMQENIPIDGSLFTALWLWKSSQIH